MVKNQGMTLSQQNIYFEFQGHMSLYLLTVCLYKSNRIHETTNYKATKNYNEIAYKIRRVIQCVNWCLLLAKIYYSVCHNNILPLSLIINVTGTGRCNYFRVPETGFLMIKNKQSLKKHLYSKETNSHTRLIFSFLQ